MTLEEAKDYVKRRRHELVSTGVTDTYKIINQILHELRENYRYLAVDKNTGLIVSHVDPLGPIYFQR